MNQESRSFDKLQALNLELAALLEHPPLSLSTGADAAARDELVICGILGGKDVGKSTLINALARSEISIDKAEVGRGTQRPVAYVHRDAQAILAARFADIAQTVDFAVHQVDLIRNVALIDLPDFDSEFVDHLEIVRRIAPLLDRVIWVVTPRKIGDRVWVGMVHDAIQDPDNVVVVLNKLDELLTDADALLMEPVAIGRGRQSAGARRGPIDQAVKLSQTAAEFWTRTQEWVGEMTVTAGFDGDGRRRFLLAAAFGDPTAFLRRVSRLWNDDTWSRYSDDKEAVAQLAGKASAELDRLRAHVLSPLPRESALAIKSANRRHELALNVKLLRQYYSLDDVIARLTAACDPAYAAPVAREAFELAYLEETAQAAQRHMRGERELADDLLEWRIEAWPLLRLVYWPFGWLSRALARRIVPASPRALGSSADAIGAAPGPSLHARVERLRSRLMADHGVILQQTRLESALPAGDALMTSLHQSLANIPPDAEAEIMLGIRAAEAARSRALFNRLGRFVGNVTLWLILLWFPFLQPLLAGLLQIWTETGAINLAQAGYQIVTAFSAAHILSGVAIVVIVFIGIVAAMHARCLRAVRKRLRAEDDPTRFSALVETAIMQTVMAPLLEPIATRLSRLRSIAATLSRLSDN